MDLLHDGGYLARYAEAEQRAEALAPYFSAVKMLKWITELVLVNSSTTITIGSEPQCGLPLVIVSHHMTGRKNRANCP
jgi:hypothetical protein